MLNTGWLIEEMLKMGEYSHDEYDGILVGFNDVLHIAECQHVFAQKHKKGYFLYLDNEKRILKFNFGYLKDLEEVFLC